MHHGLLGAHNFAKGNLDHSAKLLAQEPIPTSALAGALRVSDLTSLSLSCLVFTMRGSLTWLFSLLPMYQALFNDKLVSLYS